MSTRPAPAALAARNTHININNTGQKRQRLKRLTKECESLRCPSAPPRWDGSICAGRSGPNGGTRTIGHADARGRTSERAAASVDKPMRGIAIAPFGRPRP